MSDKTNKTEETPDLAQQALRKVREEDQIAIAAYQRMIDVATEEMEKLPLDTRNPRVASARSHLTYVLATATRQRDGIGV